MRMPPLPADSIHARACKLKCEKILTRPPSSVESNEVLGVPVRPQAGFLGSFNQTIKDCAAPGSARCIAEQEVLPAHHKGLNTALGAVV